MKDNKKVEIPLERISNFIDKHHIKGYNFFNQDEITEEDYEEMAEYEAGGKSGFTL